MSTSFLGTKWYGPVDEDGRPHGNAFEELLFEGECIHGEKVLRGCVIFRGDYRAESVYVDGVPTDDFIIYNKGRKFMEGQVDVSLLLSGFEYATPKYIKGKQYYEDGVSVKFEGEFDKGRPSKGKVYRRDGTLWWEGRIRSASFYEPCNGYVSYDHKGRSWAYFTGDGILYDENGENPRYTFIDA